MQPASSKSAQVPDSMGKSRAEWERVSDSRALGQRTLERVGNTPLLRLERVARDLPNIQLLGKAEWMNPGGSVKDRAASNIVAEACAAGRLGPGKILLDSTSGNTGIAYAMIGAAQGFPVTLCMPENVSPERSTFCALMAPTLFIPTRRTGLTAPLARRANYTPPNRRNISKPINIQMMPIGVLIIWALPMKFGTKQRAASRIS